MGSFSCRSWHSPRPLAVLLLLALAAPRPATAGEDVPRSPAGHYRLEGTNRDGSPYVGELNIRTLTDNLFFLYWRDQESTYVGQGALIGDELYAVWGSDDARCLVVFYEVGDGVLNGAWIWAGGSRDGHRGTETAVRQIRPRRSLATGIAGSYRVTGTDPAGHSYRRTLDVRALGEDYYRLRWKGGQDLEGIGFLEQDQLQVIASPDGSDGQCGRSTFEIGADGNLTSTWMLNDENFRTPGHERAIRQ